MPTVSTSTATSTTSSTPVFPIWPAPDLVPQVSAVTELAMDVLGLPFDLARAHYARAVQAGLIQRSMLASRDFSRTLGALEQLALGAWARRR